MGTRRPKDEGTLEGERVWDGLYPLQILPCQQESSHSP